MVDSVSEWPLHRVVDHLRKKEKDGEKPPSSFISCRFYIRSLAEALDYIKKPLGGLSRSQVCRYLSYHSITLVREDRTLSQIVNARDELLKICLGDGDDDTLAIMNSPNPYAPVLIRERRLNIPVYAEWVASDIEEYADACGVYQWHLVQMFLIKSLLGDEVSEELGGLTRQWGREVSCWDGWMTRRLESLQGLLSKKRGSRK
jgi:hypothetical protein